MESATAMHVVPAILCGEVRLRLAEKAAERVVKEVLPRL